MSNTWPGGTRRAMDQSEHERWNGSHYPGTRQLCSECDDPTGRCEDDSIFVGDVGPLCVECGQRLRDTEPESISEILRQLVLELLIQSHDFDLNDYDVETA